MLEKDIVLKDLQLNNVLVHFPSLDLHNSKMEDDGSQEESFA